MVPRLASPARIPLLLLGTLVLLFAIRTAGIEILFQYNTHHFIRPSRINPKIFRHSEPARVLRVDRGAGQLSPAHMLTTHL